MNKNVWLFVIFFVCTGFSAAQEQGFYPVSGICLVENDVYKKNLPPGKITIGFDVRADTLYKISSEKQVIQAGLFRKGFHAVDLRSSDFFRKTGTHRFKLECKWGDSVIAKEITIDIRLLPLYIVQKAGQSWKQRVYSLSFLIGDKLVYSTRKFAPADISFEMDLPPWEGRYNPFGLMDGIQKPPTATGIPILGAAVGLYQIVKTLSSTEKKTNEDTAPIKKQRIETTFLKTIESGDLWQWRAWVSIQAKDVETGENSSADQFSLLSPHSATKKMKIKFRGLPRKR